jgi:hypothetical protein
LEGGGGDETPNNSPDTTDPEGNNFLSLLKEGIEPADDAPEYTITGFSVKYFLNGSQLETVKIPSRSGFEFVKWQITAINTALSAAEGPKINAEINPSDILYTLTYQLKDGDPLEFPASALLKPLASAYVTISAVFRFDEQTTAAINDVQDLINDISQLLSDDSDAPVVKPYDTTDILVGKLATEGTAQALESAVKAAQTVIAGEPLTIEVTLDEFEWDPEENKYKEDEYGELIPIKTEIMYIVYNKDKILDAEKTLKAAIEEAKNKGLKTYIPSNISILAGDNEWKSVTIVDSGTYEITISGANGGHAWSQSDTLKFGGKGGHVVARKHFDKGDVLKIRIGTEGKGMARLDEGKLVKDGAVTMNSKQDGGWPNGGKGGKPSGTNTSDWSTPGSGGGGATDVYNGGNRESSNESSLKTPGVGGELGALTRAGELLLVAGGGGGAGSISKVSTAQARSAMEGGNAGSDESTRDVGTGAIPATWPGKDAASTTVTSYNLTDTLSAPYTNITATTYDKLNKTSDSYSYGEYAPNDRVVYDTGATGQGVDGADGYNTRGYTSAWEACGGGGGYYGGNAINDKNKNLKGGAGGGGSNYIGSGFSNSTNDTSTSYGNGSFKIEYINNN